MGDTAGHVVYVMKITDTMSMADYDDWTRQQLPAKVPVWHSRDHRRRVGDSIYDFRADPPEQRQGVHGAENASTDLNGRNVLLSNHYFYFGDQAIPLPDALRPIVKQGQGHRSWSNEPYFANFVLWLEGFRMQPGIHGQPQLDLFKDEATARSCALARRKDSEQDEVLGEEPAG